MSRRTLHSLLLGVGLLVLLTGSYSWVYAGLYRDYQRLEAELVRRIGDRDRLRATAAQRPVLTDSLAGLLEQLDDSPRVVLARESSIDTYDYLNRLATVGGRHMRLRFVTGERHDYDRYHSTSYMVEGEAPFDQLFGFTWKLEHYRRLYTVESLHWQEITTADGRDEAPRSLVRFRMAIAGYGTGSAAETDATMVEVGAAGAEPPPLTHNPFLPLVRDYIPPNSNDLLDVDRAELQGLSQDRVFVLDHRQHLRVLREGDPVYLGLLTLIDRQGRFAEFTLNKGGFVEKAVLRLPQRR